MRGLRSVARATTKTRVFARATPSRRVAGRGRRGTVRPSRSIRGRRKTRREWRANRHSEVSNGSPTAAVSDRSARCCLPVGPRRSVGRRPLSFFAKASTAHAGCAATSWIGLRTDVPRNRSSGVDLGGVRYCRSRWAFSSRLPCRRHRPNRSPAGAAGSEASHDADLGYRKLGRA